MDTYDLNTKKGWIYAAGLAASLGWRHGEQWESKLTGKQLMLALKVNVNLVGCRKGHEENLRNAYGSAYWAAEAVRQERTKEHDAKRSQKN